MRHIGEWILVVVVGMAILGGCSRDDAEAPWEEDVMMPPGASGDPPTTDGSCHALDGNAAPTVMDQLAGRPPLLAGGTLLEGLYTLSRYEWYDAAATLHRRKIVISIGQGGQTAKYFWQRDEEPVERVTAVIAADGNKIALRGTCPSGRDLEWDRYHVDGATLVLFSTRDGKSAVLTRS